VTPFLAQDWLLGNQICARNRVRQVWPRPGPWSYESRLAVMLVRVTPLESSVAPVAPTVARRAAADLGVYRNHPLAPPLRIEASGGEVAR
jgi:hypothetical protein